MEVLHRGGGGPTTPPCHGGVALWRRRTHAATALWSMRRRTRATATPWSRRTHATAAPWRRRSPPPWCRAIVEDPEGDEMPAHAEDRPSDCYSSSDPWRALAVKLPRPLESPSSHSSLESSSSDPSRPYQLVLVSKREREERGKKRDQKRYLLRSMRERRETRGHNSMSIYYAMKFSVPCLDIQNFLSRTYFWCRPY
jgi:hypothetical protein